MKPLTSASINAVLVVASTALVLAGIEVFLWAWSSMRAVPQPPPVPSTVVPASNTDFDAEIVIPPEIAALASSRQQVLSMPDSWKRTRTQVPGAVHANYWHGVLEVYNGDGMRWATPYPESRNDTYRVMVVGDSLTYGDGLAEQWRFSNLLEQSMGAKFKIEFLNLGRDGAQSEDILWVVRRHLPLLKPNLVIYAVCLNDFLPSGRGQYHSLSAYPFPLPDRVKNFFIHKTRTGAFLNENYDGALRALHLRADFFDDILADFQGYQRRFARDVAQMNASVLEAGLPPMISLVLDQYPSYGSVGYRIAMVAERLLAAGGAMVVPTEDFFRRFNGQAMHISRWEGHPNEVANIIWANMIAKVLRDRPDLQPFKR